MPGLVAVSVTGRVSAVPSTILTVAGEMYCFKCTFSVHYVYTKIVYYAIMHTRFIHEMCTKCTQCIHVGRM